VDKPKAHPRGKATRLSIGECALCDGYKRYADICGYNQAELEQSLSDYLSKGEVDLKQLKKSYNYSAIESCLSAWKWRF
jgi:hypothetical protein